jgi:hypothetical protein
MPKSLAASNTPAHFFNFVAALESDRNRINFLGLSSAHYRNIFSANVTKLSNNIQ